MSALILLTRPRAASERFAQEFRALYHVHGSDGGEGGALVASKQAPQIMVLPLAEIVPCGPVPDMSAYRGAVFTSQNAVAAYALGGGSRDIPAYCVGDVTAQAARDLGMRAMSSDGTAEELIADICAKGQNGPLMHLRGAQGRGRVAQRLSAAGIPCDEAVLYRQDDVPVSVQNKADLTAQAAQADVIIAPVFSPLGAARLSLLGESPAPMWVLAISKAAANALDGRGDARIEVADRPSSDAMLAGLKRLCDAAERLEGRPSPH
ncbi:uroporphyrinogen-III synthase [Litorivita sp. NS0012-18]|uniref:uroporphyrinogen-III synthase n=1 Tax=Litorivita sp. NS0012-18 TaxID=3127655 RepID=UPI003105936F